MPDPIRQKRVDLILQQLEELPTLPAVAIRVLELTRSENASAQDVVALLANDQSLTAQILQLLHHADKGVRQEIQSVERAVVLLGFEAVRNMVLAVSIFQTLGTSRSGAAAAGRFSREEFWKHSIAVACCAELLARAMIADQGKTAGVDPAEAFVCGLLHDLGKVALDAALPKSFDRVVETADLVRGNIADLERNVIGLDHMVVGKRLAEQWGLPATLCECIWLHGQAPSALPASVKNARLVNVVSLADAIAREQHLGYSGNYTSGVPRSEFLTALGLNAPSLAGVLQKLVAQIEPRAQALGLGQASASDLYLQALMQANKELGRVTGQLSAKNRRLAVRSKFFDALAHFQADLRADASMQKVLQAIGQTAVTALDVSAAAVFSVIPGQAYAEVVLLDADGDVFEHTVIDAPAALHKPSASDGPVLPAGEELEWLLAAISPRLGEARRFWVCLESDAQCIGGVVWGNKSGESDRVGTQVQELSALSIGWSLALRTTQIREESRLLAEQLAEANRRLQSAQDEIQRSKTMIAVGEMASGAAHEMNNPLAIISGRSQLLAQQLTDPKQKHAATLISEQSHCLSEIISELMDFAKPTPPQIAEADLAEIVEHALHDAKLLTDPADRSIEVTLADIPPVMVDSAQVRAALIEVICNAIQATDAKRGHVTLHAAFDTYSGRVVMTVNDNGSGMDAATLKRAFDPFFSSKPAGRRRGMGLAKALRWIESSGGSIRLESREGAGTRSVILLPAVPGSVVSEPLPEATGRRAAEV